MAVVFASILARVKSSRHSDRMKIYAEVGIGNDTFFSTEYEGEDQEYRVPRFVKPLHVMEYYVRIWVRKTVYIFSTKDGFKKVSKEKNKFKFLFGVGGVR